MGGGHDHGHSHTSGQGNKRALLWILALSASYLVAEVIGGIVSGSLALIADAAHMALDVAAVVLGLFAAWIALKPPSASKTYGYYRAEIVAAFVNAITLVAVSLWIFYEAYERFAEPPVVQGGLMAIVAAGGLLVNVIALFMMHGQRDAGLNMKGVWLHLLTDAMGSLAAMLAAFCVWKYQWYWADPVISVIIGVLIMFGAWKLLIECVDVLLVSVPKGIDTVKIKADIEALSEVKEMHDLHVWALGTGLTALSAHVRLSDNVEYGPLLEKISKLLAEQHHIEHVTIQLEPPSFEHPQSHFCAPGRSFHIHQAAH